MMGTQSKIIILNFITAHLYFCNHSTLALVLQEYAELHVYKKFILWSFGHTLSDYVFYFLLQKWSIYSEKGRGGASVYREHHIIKGRRGLTGINGTS